MTRLGVQVLSSAPPKYDILVGMDKLSRQLMSNLYFESKGGGGRV